MSSQQEKEYKARINAVMDYIQCNLHKSLTLTELAKVANFSPFHFHRLFSSFLGETLNSFIQRLRIEKSAGMLISNPLKSITEIAFDCGFSSSAAFARLFKEMYKMSASQWRSGGYKQFSKIGQTDGKICKMISNLWKEQNSSTGYFIINKSQHGGADRIELIDSKNNARRTQMSFNVKSEVKIVTMPAFSVAYIRHIGPYKGNSKLFETLWNKINTWAGPRGLLQQPDLKCLTTYHDDPEITDEQKLRLSVCISVPEDTKVDGEIGKMKIPAGKYAVGHFELNEDEFQYAWDFMYGEWMSKSGYQPDDRMCFEMCLNDPSMHPEKKYVVEIHVPVKPL